MVSQHWDGSWMLSGGLPEGGAVLENPHYISGAKQDFGKWWFCGTHQTFCEVLALPSNEPPWCINNYHLLISTPTIFMEVNKSFDRVTVCSNKIPSSLAIWIYHFTQNAFQYIFLTSSWSSSMSSGPRISQMKTLICNSAIPTCWCCWVLVLLSYSSVWIGTILHQVYQCLMFLM